MVGVGWGLHSHFHVQPNYSVEDVLWLCCVVVEVVTIIILCLNFFSVRLDCFKVHVFL